MMVFSGIEWTFATWCVVTGCSYISQGCALCYAARVSTMKLENVQKFKDGFKVQFHIGNLLDPVKDKIGKLIFLTSMGDLFHTEKQIGLVYEHEDGRKTNITGGQIKLWQLKAIFETMHLASHHVFQILTKRIDRVLEIANEITFGDHMWLGISVCTQAELQKILKLRKVEVAIKFLSLEPLIESLPQLHEYLKNVQWVICGGETTSGEMKKVKQVVNHPIRDLIKMQVEWAIDIKEQCKKAGVPFFFKQYSRIGSRKKHRLLPDITVEEYKAVLVTNRWSELPQEKIITLIGDNPLLFNAKEFNEMPTEEAERMLADAQNTGALRKARKEIKRKKRMVDKTDVVVTQN